MTVTIALPTPEEVEDAAYKEWGPSGLVVAWNDVDKTVRDSERQKAWDRLVLARVQAAAALLTPSPALTAYLALEGAMLTLDALDAPEADAVRDLMDSSWDYLTDEAQAILNNRKVP